VESVTLIHFPLKALMKTQEMRKQILRHIRSISSAILRADTPLYSLQLVFDQDGSVCPKISALGPNGPGGLRPKRLHWINNR
jgi:hypothetical protein